MLAHVTWCSFMFGHSNVLAHLFVPLYPLLTHRFAHSDCSLKAGHSVASRDGCLTTSATAPRPSGQKNTEHVRLFALMAKIGARTPRCVARPSLDWAWSGVFTRSFAHPFCVRSFVCLFAHLFGYLLMRLFICLFVICSLVCSCVSLFIPVLFCC